MNITELIAFVAGTLPSGATVSGQSWGGFNVYGDEKSMAEFRRLFHEAGRSDSLSRIIIAERVQLGALEALRPHWAKGFTSDSVAAQVSAAALSQFWVALGATNQTEAMEKLRALVAA